MSIPFAAPLDFPQPDAYPNQEWSAQTERYRTWMRYFSGDVLDTTEENVDEAVKKYPLGINYVRTVCFINAWAMLGDWRDEVFGWRSVGEGGSQEALDLLNRVGRHSRLNTCYVRQVLTSQVYGGHVWRIRKNPLAPARVQWTVIPPELFFPVWSSLDDDLLEVFIRSRIPAREAKLVWGVNSDQPQVDYVEHWTRRSYEVVVDDQVVSQGSTPAGVIPFEYVPRVNVAGEFYGISVVQDLMGLQDELNAWLADLGDAVNRETHKETLVSNLPGGIKGIRRGNGFVDLGMGLGNAKPDVHANDRAQIPSGSMDFVNMALDFARYSAGTPPVSFGEDEGSQRSSQTLTVRMWPLVQMASNNRAFVRDSLARLAHKTFAIATSAGASVPTTGYYEPDLPPILPKDREQIVNEVAVLRAAEVLGDEQALQVLDVPESERPEWLAGIDALRKAARELAGSGSTAESSTGKVDTQEER